MKIVALAAAIAAFAFPAFAEEAKPSKAVEKLALAAEATYWLIVCEREFMETPNLAPNVHAFTLGALTALNDSGQKEMLSAVLSSIGEMGREGSDDKDAGKFSPAQCERLVASFAESWQAL